MAYYTGIVNNFSDLRTVFINHLSSHGWSWNSGSEEISKGAIIVHLTVGPRDLYASGRATPGSATGGSSQCRIGRYSHTNDFDIVWPAQYSLFVFDSPDEVYLIVRHSIDAHQWLAFGKSVFDLPGTGTWLGASGAENPGTVVSLYLNYTGITSGGANVPTGPALFATAENSSSDTLQYSNNYVHHQFSDAAGPWRLWGRYSSGSTWNAVGWRSLLQQQPNAWNSEAILLPLRAWCARSEFKVSCVADLRNARHIRIDYYEPGQILTLGNDRWMVFPWYRKNANGDGSGGSSLTAHTGTLGWAIRYDGP